jgi:ABC-type transport system involved in cytochrome c biogenesis permease subunit
MTINAYQVTAGKRLKSHDEHLMLIIPVSAVTIRVGMLTVGW